MSNLFPEELKKYEITTVNDQELAASELLQKVILAGLSETDFFERASFHGGTALRIFHGLNRYSQDLDFSLIKKQGGFVWKDYLVHVQDRMKEYGCFLEFYDKSDRDSSVVIAEIRDLSIGRMLDFEWAARNEHPKKIGSLNMEMVKRDVIRFVNPKERDMVNTWTKDTFLTSWQKRA